jgi:SAM-dependent methyltransferase
VRSVRRDRTRIDEPNEVALSLATLRRTVPISTQWGFDRGQPIDAITWSDFYPRNAFDIRGRVLEIGDASYTRQFGADRVSRSDVLNLQPNAAGTTIVANLESAPDIPDDTFDCIIATQTLQLIFDLPAAIETLYRILRPDGVLLISIPGVTHLTGSRMGVALVLELHQEFHPPASGFSVRLRPDRS